MKLALERHYVEPSSIKDLEDLIDYYDNCVALSGERNDHRARYLVEPFLLGREHAGHVGGARVPRSINQIGTEATPPSEL